MDKDKIKALLALDKHLNISKAADYLGQTQSVLSRKLMQFEKEFSCKLFYRLPRGLKLTREGEIIITTCRKILKEYEQLSLTIKNIDENIRGKFKFSMHSVLAKNVIPHLEYHLEHENLNIQREYLFQSSRIGTLAVLRSEVDFAIVADAKNYPELVKINLWSEFTALYSRDGKTKTTLYYNPEMINALKIITKLKCHSYIEIADYDVLFHTIEKLDVMAILPNSVIERHLKYRLIKKFYATDISLIYRADLPKTAAVKKIIQLIKNIAPT
jgi:hypothetical protein